LSYPTCDKLNHYSTHANLAQAVGDLEKNKSNKVRLSSF
jgi:hypothetical protein